MIKKYAIVENGLVVNVVLWDGDLESWQPEEGQSAVELPDGVGIGHAYANGAFTAPVVPPIDRPIAELKAEAWEAIKAERDRRVQHGGYKVGEKWFHSDTFSRTQQMGLVMLGANIPANLQWKTLDGSFVVMTQALAGQVFAAAAASDISTFGAAETHRAAMDASADPAAYDFAGGWPVGFGESAA